MSIILDPSRLPIVECAEILDIDVYGIIEPIHIVGSDFITTMYRIMMPWGSAEPVRAPVLRIRRPIVSYKASTVKRSLQAALAQIGAADLHELRVH